jgi:hypothetical protein
MDDVFVRPTVFHGGDVCNQITGLRGPKRFREPVARHDDVREMLYKVGEDQWRMGPSSSGNSIRHAQMLSGQDFRESIGVHRLWSG